MYDPFLTFQSVLNTSKTCLSPSQELCLLGEVRDEKCIR